MKSDSICEAVLKEFHSWDVWDWDFHFFFLFRILQAVCYFLLPIVFLITSMAPFLEASSSYLHSLIIQSHIPVNRWQHIIFHILTPRIRDSCSSSPLRGSHGLSARREQRTKSSRSEGSKAGPKGRKLEIGAQWAARLLVLKTVGMRLTSCNTLYITLSKPASMPQPIRPMTQCLFSKCVQPSWLGFTTAFQVHLLRDVQVLLPRPHILHPRWRAGTCLACRPLRCLDILLYSWGQHAHHRCHRCHNHHHLQFFNMLLLLRTFGQYTGWVSKGREGEMRINKCLNSLLMRIQSPFQARVFCFNFKHRKKYNIFTTTHDTEMDAVTRGNLFSGVLQ